MALPGLVASIRATAANRGASLPSFEIGTVVMVRDTQTISVEVAGGVIDAGKAGDEPFEAGDRVVLTRRAPEHGGGAVVHGYA